MQHNLSRFRPRFSYQIDRQRHIPLTLNFIFFIQDAVCPSRKYPLNLRRWGAATGHPAKHFSLSPRIQLAFICSHSQPSPEHPEWPLPAQKCTRCAC